MQAHRELFAGHKPKRRPPCTCGNCGLCRRKQRKRENGNVRMHLPETFEEALELSMRTSGSHSLLWPPIAESIRMLDEAFPHLIGVEIGEKRRNGNVHVGQH
jgi:hypothetical protein